MVVTQELTLEKGNPPAVVAASTMSSLLPVELLPSSASAQHFCLFWMRKKPRSGQVLHLTWISSAFYFGLFCRLVFIKVLSLYSDIRGESHAVWKQFGENFQQFIFVFF